MRMQLPTRLNVAVYTFLVVAVTSLFLMLSGCSISLMDARRKLFSSAGGEKNLFEQIVFSDSLAADSSLAGIPLSERQWLNLSAKNYLAIRNERMEIEKNLRQVEHALTGKSSDGAKQAEIDEEQSLHRKAFIERMKPKRSFFSKVKSLFSWLPRREKSVQSSHAELAANDIIRKKRQNVHADLEHLGHMLRIARFQNELRERGIKSCADAAKLFLSKNVAADTALVNGNECVVKPSGNGICVSFAALNDTTVELFGGSESINVTAVTVSNPARKRKSTPFSELPDFDQKKYQAIFMEAISRVVGRLTSSKIGMSGHQDFRVRLAMERTMIGFRQRMGGKGLRARVPQVRAC